jgi:two-component system, cell cycle sensor histidine kinase and response regulator CckA
VEDEPVVLDATCRILKCAGFLVLPAIDAREARQIFDEQSREIDLVMTDLVLPDRSGLQLVADLRLLSPSLAVLVTSGYAETECDGDSLDGSTHYLPKPYCRGTLIGKISEILGTPALKRVANSGGQRSGS